jgi:membrane-associated phospholipid phosphatase
MDRPLAHRLGAIAVIVSLLAFATLTLVAVTPVLHGIDRQIKTTLDEVRYPRLELPMRVVTFIGDGWTLLVLTVVTSVALGRRRDPLARRLPAIMLGAAVTEWIIKWLVARPRPRGSPSAFPSGHVFTSVAFFGAVVYLLWTRDVARPWRIVGTAACLVVIVGIALSRVYLRFHWLTDVLGGIAGGTAYLLIALVLTDRPARGAAGVS